MALRVCPECNRELPFGAPADLCPNCLLQLGVAAAPRDCPGDPKNPQDSRTPFNRSFGDYELIEELARGGMGAVFRARQISLNRTVAIKLLHGGVFATPNHVKRFKLEAEAVARLDHPNIVPIYEVGEHDGQPYFSMRLVEGGTLLDAVKRQRLDSRATAELMATVARAVHFAHQRGILHRDLKPTNILLDAEGRPHVTDFGLAKLLESESDLTLTLAVLGTPAYMSPEQAAGQTRDLTTAGDIYSLGAVLYELLSGRPPFTGTTTTAVLRQVVETDPTSPRKHNAAVDADLETICLKCLAKDPARRYGSAAELADELERWRAGRPILARPTSATERFGRWARRNPVLAAVSSALVFSLALGAVMLTVAYRQAETALHASLITQVRAQLAGKQVGQRFEAMQALRQAAQIAKTLDVRNEAAAALARPDARLLSRWPVLGATVKVTFSSDLETYVVGHPTGCEFRRSRDQSLVRFFPHQDQRKVHRDLTLRNVVFSRDDRRFVAQFSDQYADVWDLEGEAPLLTLHIGAADGGDSFSTPNVEFTPDGTEIICYTKKDGLFVHSLVDGRRRTLENPTGGVTMLRLDPSGTRLVAVCSNTVELLDFKAGKRLWSAPVVQPVPWAAWSPDGRLIAAGKELDSDIVLFAAATGVPVARLAGHLAAPFRFEFHPDGQWLASSARDSTIRLWDHRNGQLLFEATTGFFGTLQFSPDGKRLATGAGTDQIGISELSGSEVFREFQGTGTSTEIVNALTASHNGRFLVSAAYSDFRIWDTQAGREVAVVETRKHFRTTKVFFGPADREIIYSREPVGTFRYPFSWQEGERGGPATVNLGPRQTTEVPKATVLLSLGSDDRTWLILNASPDSEIWPDGNPAQRRIANRMAARQDVSLSPDARWSAATVLPPGDVEVWDVANPHPVTILKKATAFRRRVFRRMGGGWWARRMTDITCGKSVRGGRLSIFQTRAPAKLALRKADG